MDPLVVVLILLHLFFRLNASQWDLDVPVFVLAADHKPDLAARVGRDGRVRVLDYGENLFAYFLQVPDQIAVQPDALPWNLAM